MACAARAGPDAKTGLTRENVDNEFNPGLGLHYELDNAARGVTFLAMIPLLTYDLGGVQLNAVYFPKIGNYNEVAAFGFYATIPVGQWLRQSVIAGLASHGRLCFPGLPSLD